MRSIGDLASFLLSSRFQARLESSANSAAQAATTGLAPDKARHLNGATLAVSLLDRKTVLLEQHRSGIAEAAIFAGTTQSILGKIQDQLETVSQNLALVSQLQTPGELKTISDRAADVFVDTVNALNAQIAGKYVFSGAATQLKPLPTGDELLNMLRTATSGAAIASDVTNALDTWFDAPASVFETMTYQGSDTGFVTLPLSQNDTATFGLRADGETIREALKALGQAALAGDAAVSLSVMEQKRLLDQSRSQLIQASRSVTEERSSLGLMEEIIETARINTEADLDQIAIDRLTLVGLDQYTAAAEFEASQQQLEIFYRVAARQSRTSLAEYLR